MEFDYIFGPVQSSRLGLSLGLDLLGQAICSFDCLYCEVGRTRKLTLERKPYVPARTILDELARWKAKAARMPDYVTLGGSGEPCLNSDMGRIIDGVREIMPGIPVAVLTNSSLLPDPEVRRQLAKADAVLPSLDTLRHGEFTLLNRPHPRLTLEAVSQGLLDFRREYQGRLLLEILLVKGVNDSQRNLDRLAAYCRELKPDRVDVVTMTRPGAWEEARPVDEDTLARWREVLAVPDGGKFSPGSQRCAPAAEFTADDAPEGLLDRILGSVSRRPQTATQLVFALGAEPKAVRAALDMLVRDGLAQPTESDGRTFYSARRKDA